MSSFFDRLYCGYEAEHYVAGKLYAENLECFRSPADFGFDLIVTNIKETCHDQRVNPLRMPLPYAIQVKSRRVSPDIFVGEHRPEASIEFIIKKDNLWQISREPRAFLVCVVFILDESNVSKSMYFWLNSSQLQYMQRKGYIVDCQDSRFCQLTAVIRMMPVLDVYELIDQLSGPNGIPDFAVKELKKKLPQYVEREWNTKPYISVSRAPRNDSQSPVVRRLPKECLSFQWMGVDVGTGDLD